MSDLFGYTGKNVVIDGAASGMGLAATKVLLELGADVYALDIKELQVNVKKFIKVDLGKKESIDAALQQLPAQVHAYFGCAALPGPPFADVDVVTVNFLGHRHLVEGLLPRMGEGSAIAMIASLAGMGWMQDWANIKPLLATKGFEEGRAWLEAHPEVMQTMGGAYGYSKECLIGYTKVRARELAGRKIRINILSPASTATPMLAAFIANATQEVIDAYTVDKRYATPEEMAEPLVFLNSNMARFISGVDLQVDNSIASMMTIQMIGGA